MADTLKGLDRLDLTRAIEDGESVSAFLEKEGKVLDIIQHRPRIGNLLDLDTRLEMESPYEEFVTFYEALEAGVSKEDDERRYRFGSSKEGKYIAAELQKDSGKYYMRRTASLSYGKLRDASSTFTVTTEMGKLMDYYGKNIQIVTFKVLNGSHSVEITIENSKKMVTSGQLL
jgi:hypothetical protein